MASADNPADDLTRGKRLQELTGQSRWSYGPPFLSLPPPQWPEHPLPPCEDFTDEQRRPMTCLVTSVSIDPVPDAENFDNFSDLIKETAKHLHGAASDPEGTLSADDFKEAELCILRSAQRDSFHD